MVGQLTLDQHIGVRIPGGQPSLSSSYEHNFGLLIPGQRIDLQILQNENLISQVWVLKRATQRSAPRLLRETQVF